MIYFIRGMQSGNIKIGFSVTPEQRKTNLQTAHYEELEIIGMMTGSLTDERSIKSRFAKSRIRGEWYRPDPDVLAYIKNNATKPPMHVVSSCGNGEYEVIFSRPVKATMEFLLLVGSHNMRILTDEESSVVFGIVGKRPILLDWFASLGSVSKENFDAMAASMTD